MNKGDILNKLEQADFATKNKKYDIARIIYMEIHGIDKLNVKIIYKIAQNYSYIKNYIHSEEWYRKLLSINPLDIYAIKCIAKLYQRQEKYEEAIVLCDEALSINYNDGVKTLKKDLEKTIKIREHFDNVKYYKKNNNVIEMLKCIDQILLIEPHHALSKKELIAIDLKEQNLKEALKKYIDILTHTPNELNGVEGIIVRKILFKE